jgi:DNA-binding transcriptional LysR family regulator
MDIDRVRYFCVIADCGSLVKASEILNISQPALSKALRLLEHEVYLKLCEREGRGLRLTDNGLKFREMIQPLLKNWLAIPSQLNNSQLKSSFRLGSFEVFTTYFLGHFIQQIKMESNIEIYELGPGKLEEAIGDRRIDVGITYLPIPKPNVNFIETAQIKMGVYGIPTAFGELKFTELPWVVPLAQIQGTPSKVMGLDGWPDHLVQRNIQFKVTMMESALELCRRGLAIAYLPEFIVRQHNRYMKKNFELLEMDCPLPKKLRMQSVFLILHSSMDETPTIKMLAKCLRSLK